MAAEEALTCANCGTAEVKFSCARCKVAHYCSRTCQKHHWKGGGHKKSCVAQVVEQAVAQKESNSTPQPLDYEKICAICHKELVPSDDASSSSESLCALPCTHRFHEACVEKLREAGVQQQPCPMCRAQTPPSAQKTFEDGFAMYYLIKKSLEKIEDSPWPPLTKEQQETMDEAKRLWEMAAAEEGTGNSSANAQCMLGLIHDAGWGVKRDPEKAVEW